MSLGALEVLQTGVMRYGMLTIAVWALFAGLGVTSIGTDDEQKQKVQLPELTVEEITEEITEDAKKIKFIENPLPLPKKHQKKEMDFDREVGEQSLEFDFDINADDDFDIS